MLKEVETPSVPPVSTLGDKQLKAPDWQGVILKIFILI